MTTSEAEMRMDINFSKLMDLYVSVLYGNNWQPFNNHMFCFKASGGVDSNMPRLSMVHLFNPFSKLVNEVYSSNEGSNVLATA